MRRRARVRRRRVRHGLGRHVGDTRRAERVRLEHAVPLRAGCGAFQRFSPTGGAANGMPLKMRTVGCTVPVTPSSRPVSIVTCSGIMAEVPDTVTMTAASSGQECESFHEMPLEWLRTERETAHEDSEPGARSVRSSKEPALLVAAFSGRARDAQDVAHRVVAFVARVLEHPVDRLALPRETAASTAASTCRDRRSSPGTAACPCRPAVKRSVILRGRSSGRRRCRRRRSCHSSSSSRRRACCPPSVRASRPCRT